jgi:tRNA dimethylallyltransferase
VRDAVRLRLDTQGVEALHAELALRDPAMAARLGHRDRARVSRALEVMIATGRSLADWQRDGLAPPLPQDETACVFLGPEREALYARIDKRFAAMIEEGALAEVERLAARRLDPVLPAMKAHGVPWLIRHLAGEMPLAAAIAAAQADTRHYAKRQFTWFRHQLGHWPQVAPGEAFAYLKSALSSAA